MNEERIKELLAGIASPTGDGDLVSDGVVTEVEVEGDGIVTVVLTFDGVDRQVRHELEDQVRSLLAGTEGITEVYLEVEVPDLPPPPAKKEAGLSMHGGGAPAAAAAPKDALGEVTHIIAVASGKGGVGKSTVAVNLALALAARGGRVGICDIDVYGPSVPIQLGVAKAKPQVSADQKRFMPVEAYGLKVMSIGFLVDDDTPVVWRGPIVDSIIKQFLKDVEWGALDYLVLDMPPGTGDAQLTISQAAPPTGVVIVTTPSELALVDAVKGLQMFRKVDVPVIGVVENMSHYACPGCGHESHPFNKGGVERIAKQFGAPLLASVPVELEIQRGSDTGKPIMAVAPESVHAQAFLGLADAVMEKCPRSGDAKEPEKKGFLSGLFRR
jgi:ATP-binding protein involved in chromosome partitioning